MYATAGTRPKPEDIYSIVKCGGAKVLHALVSFLVCSRGGASVASHPQVCKRAPTRAADNVIVVSCQRDMGRGKEGRKLKQAGFAV